MDSRLKRSGMTVGEALGNDGGKAMKNEQFGFVLIIAQIVMFGMKVQRFGEIPWVCILVPVWVLLIWVVCEAVCLLIRNR